MTKKQTKMVTKLTNEVLDLLDSQIYDLVDNALDAARETSSVSDEEFDKLSEEVDVVDEIVGRLNFSKPGAR